MMKKTSLVIAIGVLAFLASWMMAEDSKVSVRLRPVQETYSHTVPFYQAVPVAKGQLYPKGRAMQLWKESLALQAEVNPVAYWADGSVRWLSVDGIWPAGMKADGVWTIREKEHGNQKQSLQWQVECLADRNEIAVLNAKGETVLTMAPFAARMAIELPRPVLPVNPEWLETEGQYTWAQPFESLSADPKIEALALTVVDQLLEVNTAEYVQYRVRGKSTGSESQGMEWQLRLRIYPDIGLIRSEMTWKVLWDVERYALVSATWKIQDARGYSSLISSQEQVRLEQESEWILLNEVDGRSGVWLDGERIEEYAQVNKDRNVWLLSDPQRTLGLAIPDFGKKGPSHCLINRQGIEIAMWSHLSGKALDLRSSGQPDEFGISGKKLESDGKGFSYTLEASLILSEDEQNARELATYEEAREGIWFPAAEELGQTSALEHFERETLESNAGYFSGLHANLLFLVRARDEEKWYGVVNYGDYRTNFARGHDESRGLYPGHWALHGRYGWRNGSGGITEGLLKAGLFLEDREITLAAWEHARHVVDVDICHGSFFKPYRGAEGGMHRRNRDHWSGSVQMQYTPTAGIYLTSWLGGNSRVRDALEGIRDYSERDGGTHSVFAAQAWIYRYMETGKVEDYQKARQLLHNGVAFWEPRGRDKGLTGVAALYAGNFRRVSDGLKTLIAFYQATEHEEYLRAIRESMEKHGVWDRSVDVIGRGYVLAWLSAHGVEAAREDLYQLKSEIQKIVPEQFYDIHNMDYSELTRLITEQLPPQGSPLYRESNAIAKRSSGSFLIMRYWGK